MGELRKCRVYVMVLFALVFVSSLLALYNYKPAGNQIVEPKPYVNNPQKVELIGEILADKPRIEDILDEQLIIEDSITTEPPYQILPKLITSMQPTSEEEFRMSEVRKVVEITYEIIHCQSNLN
jgi:hypothetical protein